MTFNVEVFVSPRKDILDPQGKAVESALANIGYRGVSGVRVGKYLAFILEAESEASGKNAVDEMCRKLLANPVVEDFEIKISPA
ncbi:MAG: phosphoribosylformylglycinamidine synthase subunit PurS [bacterium]|jgi:phosphoribosylformylglycinamidine synthase